jgi:hypothetical protein
VNNGPDNRSGLLSRAYINGLQNLSFFTNLSVINMLSAGHLAPLIALSLAAQRVSGAIFGKIASNATAIEVNEIYLPGVSLR